MKKSIDLFLLLLLVICSCSSGSSSEIAEVGEPDNVGALATLKTNEAEDIAAKQVIVWAKLENNGGSSVFERGLCYGTAVNPSYEGTKKMQVLLKGQESLK